VTLDGHPKDRSQFHTFLAQAPCSRIPGRLPPRGPLPLGSRRGIGGRHSIDELSKRQDGMKTGGQPGNTCAKLLEKRPQTDGPPRQQLSLAKYRAKMPYTRPRFLDRRTLFYPDGSPSNDGLIRKPKTNTNRLGLWGGAVHKRLGEMGKRGRDSWTRQSGSRSGGYRRTIIMNGNQPCAFLLNSRVDSSEREGISYDRVT